MTTLHGTCTSISQVGQLSSYGIDRNIFLDGSLKSKVATQVGSGKDLLFLGNDVTETRRKEAYQMIIHGILPCGSKTTLIINGIDPHVDIRLLEDETHEQARKRIDRMVNMIADEEAKVCRYDFKTGKDFMYYDHKESQYARVHFRSLKTRTEFLAVCTDMNVKTYSNDKSTYYRVVSRGYEINLSGWNVVRNYERTFGQRAHGSKATYIFTVDVNDIKPVADDCELAKYANSQGFEPSVVKYENMIISSFDIEMIPEKPDRFPDADKNPNDSIFMICMTYHFVKRPESILSVCLTLAESAPLDDVFMVHCQSEACLLAAFARFMAMMQPDFITEFNGGGFDWRNIITKTRYCGMIGSFLEDMSLVKLQRWEKSDSMLSRFHRETRIKINGATADSICKSLKMQGFVSFDTLVVFKQLEPNADSHKLNECLRRCNLGGKDDLDIKEMFRMYREKDLKEMSIVAHYCFIDTFKLQQLQIKKNIIQDRREVANLSYTSIQDNFNYAGGSRMRNLLMNRGSKLGYFFDTEYRPEIEDPEAKFPGAHVVPPIKGIVKPTLRFDEYLSLNNIEHDESTLSEGYKFIEDNFNRIYRSDEVTAVDQAPDAVKDYVEYAKSNKTQYPISGLDYASLYPSIIMTYNISPEKLIIDEEYAKKLEGMGYVLQYVTFPFCKKMMHAWFVRHNNVEEDYSICGKLLIELFARRAALKKTLKHLGESIYEMEQELKPFLTKDAINEYPRLDEYNETKFDHVCCDSKQKAVKVFMNTLYGEMGNFLSCICAVQVAASVTTMGKYNLLLAKAFVERELQMKVYYGDTDSLYVACSPVHFIDYDREYFSGKINKIKYGTLLVEETFKQIEVTKQLVNEHLTGDNGSKFLKMAYEEVLYPAAFLSKKKYYGVPHEENVDFYPRKLFLRGLEIVKRGASDVLKDVVNEVIRELMDIKTTRDILTILKEAVARVFNTNWSIDAFAKTKVYRPDKKNIAVLTMMARYRLINYHTIPEPNVRFKYVICKYYPWTYDIEGRQTKQSTGDRMELVDRVHEEGLEIDLEYYFDNELTGQFARLITFCDEFADAAPIVEPIDLSTMDEIEVDAYNKELYQRSEDALFKAAKKYIGQLAKHYSKAYINKGSLFANTWREVCNFITARPDIYASHLNATTGIIFEIFANANATGKIHQDLANWIVRHVAKRYRTALTDEQLQKLNRAIEPIEQYLVDRKLTDVITGGFKMWTHRVVEFIREEYDYDYICKANLPYETIWDVLTRQEFELILRDCSLFPSVSTNQAMEIIDMISNAIAQVLTIEQLA